MVLNAYKKKKYSSENHEYIPCLQQQSHENRSQVEPILNIQVDSRNQPSAKKIYRPYDESNFQLTGRPTQWSLSDSETNAVYSAIQRTKNCRNTG